MNNQIKAMSIMTLVNSASGQRLEIKSSRLVDNALIEAYQGERHLRTLVKTIEETQVQIEKWLLAGFVVKENYYQGPLS